VLFAVEIKRLEMYTPGSLPSGMRSWRFDVEPQLTTAAGAQNNTKHYSGFVEPPSPWALQEFRPGVG
jgi:hypothetical protein